MLSLSCHVESVVSCRVGCVMLSLSCQICFLLSRVCRVVFCRVDVVDSRLSTLVGYVMSVVSSRPYRVGRVEAVV